MEDKINKIRLACAKANPEIMELKFGCEVKLNGRRLFVVGIALSTFDNCIVGDGAEGIHNVKKSDLEILGRPIRLADVLFVIRQWNVKKSIQWEEHTKIVMAIIGSSSGNGWKLLKDDLREQTPETIDFISNLLE